MDLGKKIKSLRLQKGVTQETLASELGVTAQAVSKWENGHYAAGHSAVAAAVSIFRRQY